MKIHLGLVGLAAIFVSYVGVTVDSAQASCAMGDYICEKFARKKVIKSPTKTRRRVRRTKRRAAVKVGRAPASAISNRAVPIKTSLSDPDLSTTRLNRKIVATAPVLKVTRLAPGAISEAPKDLTNLIFASAEQVQSATAKCRPLLHSTGRLVCHVAVHRLTLNGDTGAGCSGALDLRALKFAKDDKGAWINEDSISLCGGRLLRRSTLFPVSVNGEPLYGMSEEYQLLGGDGACAAPYLRGRYPLQKSYLPVGKKRAGSLRCGTVAIR